MNLDKRKCVRWLSSSARVSFFEITSEFGIVVSSALIMEIVEVLLRRFTNKSHITIGPSSDFSMILSSKVVELGVDVEKTAFG